MMKTAAVSSRGGFTAPRDPGVRARGIAGALLGAALLLRFARPAAPQAPRWPSGSMPEHFVRITALRSASAEAIWRARWFRTLSALAAGQRQDALEAWDPALIRRAPGRISGAWPAGQAGPDPSGNLRLAIGWAMRGATLARTPGEAYQAAECLWLIDRDSGLHWQEARDARTMAGLQPVSPLTHTSRTSRSSRWPG